MRVVPYHNQYPVHVSVTNPSDTTILTASQSFYQPWGSYNSTPITITPLSHSPIFSADTSPVDNVETRPNVTGLESNQSLINSHTTTSPFVPPSPITPPCDSDSGNSSSVSSDSSSSLPVYETSICSNTKFSSFEEISIKKNTRTNYSPQQLRSLEKIFLETPYPESELMEQISCDLSIPEKNLKIWFQNKRARWRKRVRDNKPAFPPVNPGYMPSLPVSAPQYSMMSPSALMSPLVSSFGNCRTFYNLPNYVSTPVNTTSLQSQQQIPAYINPYMYPQYR